MFGQNVVARVVLLALVLAGAAGRARGSVIYEVSQESAAGAGDFAANVLGTIEAFATTGTGAEYYAHNMSHADSYGSNPPLASMVVNRSHLFLVEGSDGLSLIVVHDKPMHGTGTNNGGGTANTRVELFGDTAAVLAKDDPSGDVFTIAGGGTMITMNQVWVNPNTDGAVIGSLDGDWTLHMQFRTMPSGTSVNSWAAYSGDGGIIPLTLAVSQRVQIVPVPEPEIAAGVGLLVALAVLRRIRRVR